MATNWLSFFIMVVIIILAIIVIIYLITNYDEDSPPPLSPFQVNEGVIIRSTVADAPPLTLQSGCVFDDTNEGSDNYLEGNCVLVFRNPDSNVTTNAFRIYTHNNSLDPYYDQNQSIVFNNGNRFFVDTSAKFPSDSGDAFQTGTTLTNSPGEGLYLVAKGSQLLQESVNSDELWAPYFQQAVGIGGTSTPQGQNGVYFLIFASTDDPRKVADAVGRVRPSPGIFGSTDFGNVSYRDPGINIDDIGQQTANGAQGLLEYIFYIDKQNI